ncbi:MAG: hypothetical protein J6A04_04755 [Clostridia bacterium]|nr:hypothetical protein [Clostridia bacterium]
MKEISEMQRNQNNINLSYIRDKQKNLNKPRLKVKNLKDIATLIGPSAKKYRLSPNQRNFQLKGRLTIAAIAAALAIGGISVGNSISNDTAETQEILQEEELMNAFEDKLLDCVFSTNRNDVDNPEVSYDFDNHDGSTILRVTSGTGDSKKVLFTYSKGGLSFDSLQNAKEISSLINNAMDIHFAKEPSQKQLQNLNESLENLENKNFKLKDKHIVEDKQIELDEER